MRLIGKLQQEWRVYKTLLACPAETAILAQAAFYVGAMAMYVILSKHRRDEAFPPLLIEYMNNLCAKATTRSSQPESSV